MENTFYNVWNSSNEQKQSFIDELSRFTTNQDMDICNLLDTDNSAFVSALVTFIRFLTIQQHDKTGHWQQQASNMLFVNETSETSSKTRYWTPPNTDVNKLVPKKEQRKSHNASSNHVSPTVSPTPKKEHNIINNASTSTVSTLECHYASPSNQTHKTIKNNLSSPMEIDDWTFNNSPILIDPQDPIINSSAIWNNNTMVSPAIVFTSEPMQIDHSLVLPETTTINTTSNDTKNITSLSN